MMGETRGKYKGIGFTIKEADERGFYYSSLRSKANSCKDEPKQGLSEWRCTGPGERSIES